MQELFQDQRVVITGPSKSILSSDQGELIDSYDLVVRVNWQWPIEDDLKPHLGERMDVLYHCAKNEPYARPFHDFFEVEDFYKVKMVCYAGQQRDGEEFGQLLDKAGIEKHDLSLFCLELRKNICDELNTGYVAIKHLLSQPLKELYVTGFTFHQEPYYESYCTANWWDEDDQFNSRGKPDILLADFIKECDEDKRIKLDRPLHRIVYGGKLF